MQKPEYIDIHTHLNFAAYDADREEVIGRMLVEKVWAINVGTQKDTSLGALELAQQYDNLFAIVGTHPIHSDASYHDKEEFANDPQFKGFTTRGEEFDLSYYEKLAEDPKVVALGETGLDYFRSEEDSIEKQRKNFIAHIELAEKLDKPLMLHLRSGKDRSAYKDAYEILKNYPNVKAHSHFFAGSIEELKLFLEAGYTVSFTGVITFTNDYNELVEYVPLDMVMSETDAPYVTPVPHRGKRNEPIFVKEVVKKIAEIKKLPLEQVKERLVENAFRVFKLTL